MLLKSVTESTMQELLHVLVFRRILKAYETSRLVIIRVVEKFDFCIH